MVGMFINTIPARVLGESGQPLPCAAACQAGQSEARGTTSCHWRRCGRGPGLRGILSTHPRVRELPVRTGATVGPRIVDVRARDATNFPLNLRAYLTDRLGFDLGYDPSLFDTETVRALGDRLLTLLTAVAADPIDGRSAAVASPPTSGAGCWSSGAAAGHGLRVPAARWSSGSRPRAPARRGWSPPPAATVP
jgi:hypothetical protein